MNRGMKSGMHPYQWRNYTPRLDCWGVGAGTTVSPVLGSGAGYVQNGRYLYIPNWRLCFYEFWIGFGSVGNSGGSGVNANYLISLPVQMRRFVSQFDTNDRPIGAGFISQSTNQFPQVPLTFVAADFGGRSYGRNRDDFMQAFCHGLRMSGTATITSAATSIAVTWPGSITLDFAPNASDLIVVATNAATTITGKDVFITNVTATGFTINVNTAPGTSGLTFAWKLMGDNQLLLCPQAPWNVGGTGDYIRGSVTYETAA